MKVNNRLSLLFREDRTVAACLFIFMRLSVCLHPLQKFLKRGYYTPEEGKRDE